MIRGGTLSVAPMLQLLPVALAMMAEAVSAAFMGWRWYTGPRAARGDGTALVVEDFLPQGQLASTDLLFGGSYLHIRGIGCYKSSE